jgi:hypothetical protein
MEGHMANNHKNNQNAGWIISGVAIGTGIVLAYAASRRRKDKWQNRLVEGAETVVRKREDLIDSGRDVIDRIRIIYDESRKLVEDASDLWAHGRRLVRG